MNKVERRKFASIRRKYRFMQEQMDKRADGCEDIVLSLTHMKDLLIDVDWLICQLASHEKQAEGKQ